MVRRRKEKAIIASRYLNSVGKGENALELATILQDKYVEDSDVAVQEFHVPEYIKMQLNGCVMINDYYF